MRGIRVPNVRYLTKHVTISQIRLELMKYSVVDIITSTKQYNSIKSVWIE